MRVRRLGWAGIEIEANGARAVIDAVTQWGQLTDFVGPPLTPLLPPTGPVDLAMVTHLHTDHTDAANIASSLRIGGGLLRPTPAVGEGNEVASTAAAEAELAMYGVPATVVQPWETVHAGPFAVTALPAVDGFGDPQVSWVVEADGRRIFHGGDTLFHGSWWLIARRYGPFDAVFLPVNGAVCNYPHLQPPSPLPADLTPEHAAVAANILRSRLAVPIHYDAIEAEGVYEQVDDPARTFLAAAKRTGLAAQILPVGEALDVAAN